MMLRRAFFAAGLCLAFSLFANEETEPLSPAQYCYFHPPKDWEIADPRHLGPQVKVGFIKKVKEGLHPSLNLAVETVEGNLTEYLNDVKSNCERDRKNHWRKLGKVHTQAGEAQLTEIDTHSPFGPVRLLQLILLKEEKAYILTAAALKKDIPNFYRDFQNAFHSLTLTQDLFDTIPQLERRTHIKLEQEILLQHWEQTLDKEAFQNNHWASFQKKIMDEYEDMGAFWQILALIHVRDSVLKMTKIP